jgi:hypothetical protein
VSELWEDREELLPQREDEPPERDGDDMCDMPEVKLGEPVRQVLENNNSTLVRFFRTPRAGVELWITGGGLECRGRYDRIHSTGIARISWDELEKLRTDLALRRGAENGAGSTDGGLGNGR